MVTIASIELCCKQRDGIRLIKNRPVNVDFDSIVNFVLTMKNIAEKLTLQRIRDLRDKLEKMMLQTKGTKNG